MAGAVIKKSVAYFEFYISKFIITFMINSVRNPEKLTSMMTKQFL